MFEGLRAKVWARRSRAEQGETVGLDEMSSEQLHEALFRHLGLVPNDDATGKQRRRLQMIREAIMDALRGEAAQKWMDDGDAAARDSFEKVCAVASVDATRLRSKVREVGELVRRDERKHEKDGSDPALASVTA